MTEKNIIPTEIIKDVYNDGFSPALKEAGKLGKDLIKTIRLLTIPIQYTAHIQDRLEKHLKKLTKEIPKENITVPPEPILIPILEKLKYYDSDDTKNELSKMYQELLKKSFDKHTTSLVHPSFIDIIGQLSSDEVKLFNQIANNFQNFNQIFVYDDIHSDIEKIYVKDKNFIRITKIDYDVKEITFSDKKKKIIKDIDKISISFTDIINLEYIQVYFEHLEKLGLIQHSYSGNYIIRVDCEKKEQVFNKGKYTNLDNIQVKSKRYKLTEFGKLFYKIVTK